MAETKTLMTAEKFLHLGASKETTCYELVSG